MIICNLEQRSDEWHKWRLDGIGSSEAATLMGISEHKTLETLWEEKIGLIKPINHVTRDMQRGIDNEDRVVEIYCQQEGIEFKPLTAINDTYSFVRSSFDAINLIYERFAEVKCPRPYIHQKTKRYGTIKPEYYCQMQHQYLTCGFNFCDFLSFDVESEDFCKIFVEPNYYYMGELLDREIRFWWYVENRIRPPEIEFPMFDPTPPGTSLSSIEF